MKKIILVCVLLLLSNLPGYCQSTFEAASDNNIIEPILYLYDSDRRMMHYSFEVMDEVDYISDNISNVSISYVPNMVYISWNVCDDSTNSVFYITKTSDTNLYIDTIGYVLNVPCTPHVPLLYSLEDRDIKLDKNNFYKLYKMKETGEIVHIITLIVPKETKINKITTSK